MDIVKSLFLFYKNDFISVENVACSRLRDSRVRWIEKARTFRVPFSFASSLLSENLEQAMENAVVMETFLPC